MSVGEQLAGTRAGKAYQSLLKYFQHSPTPSQQRLFVAISRMLTSSKPRCTLVVKGYAGTGKTSAVNALVKYLESEGRQAVLLAPTGRAAKVLAHYTSRSAYTIHKAIYQLRQSARGGIYFTLAYNPWKHTVFVVDEASMIGGFESGQRHLLADLLEFIFSAPNCRLILIGDAAQLPPVGADSSPALHLEYLQQLASLTLASVELTEVMRQREDAGILALATDLRSLLFSSSLELPMRLPHTPDVRAIGGDELQELLETRYGSAGHAETITICRSNQRCYQFNQQIRTRILFREEVLNAGDLLMVVKNNYHWLQKDQAAGFIANGDIVEVQSIDGHSTLAGFNFVWATVRLIDYPEQAPVELLLWVDAVESAAAAMDQQAWDRLYRAVSEKYDDLSSKAERMSAIRKDPYYNAVQVKYAYAITCHKAQGGQWPVVIVDQGYITEEMLVPEYYRWLYTAVSRATEQLYLLNFSDRIFVREE